MTNKEPDRVERVRRRVDGLSDRSGIDHIRAVVCDPARLQIIRALQSEPLSVGDIAAVLRRHIQNTSQHLRVLRNLGLVDRERRGSTVYYQLRPGARTDQLQAICSIIDGSLPRAS